MFLIKDICITIKKVEKLKIYNHDFKGGTYGI